MLLNIIYNNKPRKWQIILIVYIAIISLLGKLDAQCIGNSTDPCCNELINIDPITTSFTVNNERLSLPAGQSINFSQLDINYLNPSAPTFKVYSSVSGLVRTPNNPLFSTDPEYKMITNYDPIHHNTIEDNPMHPRYGWQLMHGYNGFRPFTATATSPVFMTTLGYGLTGFHYLFYNRHTGQTRLFTNVESLTDYDPKSLSVNFGFEQLKKTNISGLFNYYNDRMVALDDYSVAKYAKSFLPAAQNIDPNFMNTTDFNLWYDPCVCTKNLEPLKIELFKRNTLSLYAEGKYSGITKPFDNSGQLPSSFGKDWLTSVYGDYDLQKDFEVQGGFQVYRTAQQMVNDYYVSPGMQFLGEAMNLFGGAAGSIPAISIGSTTISQLWGTMTNPSGQISTIYQNVNQSDLDIPIGNILGKAASKFSGMINPSVPNVMFTEGQIALRGKIIQDLNWGGFSFRSLAHPGSRGAQSVSLDKYPYYNEAPGLFTLVKTPIILH